MSDVAASLSLPEALLLIRQDNQRQMEQLRYDTQSRALANAAIWSKPALRALQHFDKSLKNNGNRVSSGHPTDLARRYAQAGVPIRQT